jgi:hypothetical protein
MSENTTPPIAPPASKIPLIAGFLTGAVPWLVCLVPQKDYNQILCLIIACFPLPILAAVLAIIPRTRRFGLGLLLACGVGWLILGAICGGVIK